MEKFSEIKYTRPSIEEAETALKAQIQAFTSAPDYPTARQAFMQRQAILDDYKTLHTIASIRNTMNTTDEFYAGEIAYFNETLPRLAVLEKEFNSAMVKSPYQAEFTAEFGEQLFRLLKADIKTNDACILAEQVQEAKLGTAYSKSAASCKTMFRGDECNFYGLLRHMLSTDRQERKDAMMTWADLYEKISPDLDRQYDELVALRSSEAKKLGFANYIDMIYMVRHRFDYNAADIAKFRGYVRDHVVPAAQKIYNQQAKRLGVDKLRYYDETLKFPEGNAKPVGSQKELVAAAQQMYRELSPETGEFFDFMVDHELFDLQTRPGKHLGGYCTSLTKYNAPFIFSNFNGTSADVDVLTHEAGHAFMDYTSGKTQKINEYKWSTSEVNEIHSMSMEFFAYPWMDHFFGDASRKYLYAHLAECITTIPYLVSVDEFQHRVFENPGMDAAGRRQAWKKIEQIYLPWRDYDGNQFLENGGFWMQKQHIFLYPFYYVDYALAQLCAFQFLIRMQNSRSEAWHDYYHLCTLGGSLGYFDLLKAAHLENPLQEKTVQQTIEGVTAILDTLKID